MLFVTGIDHFLLMILEQNKKTLWHHLCDRWCQCCPFSAQDVFLCCCSPDPSVSVRSVQSPLNIHRENKERHAKTLARFVTPMAETRIVQDCPVFDKTQ